MLHARSGFRRPAAWIAVALLIGAVWMLLWHDGGSGAAEEPRADDAAAPPDAAEPSQRVPEASVDELARGEVRPAAPGAGELGLRLRRAAEIELLAMRAGSMPPADQAELERLLAPSLAREEELREILDHLVSRTWSEGDGARPSTTEFGAIRFLYWGLLLRHTQGSSYFDAAAGEDLFVALISALPQMVEGLRSALLDQVLQVRIEGRSLVGIHLSRVLELRAMFPEHKQLFSALLAVLEQELTAAEKDALFGMLLVDETDPVLVGTSLRNLLKGNRIDLAMSMAADLFDRPDASPELREAIAMAVVEGLDDPFAAAQFVVERTQRLRNEPAVWITLGYTEGGTLAAQDRYQELLENAADPLARKLLVMGMRGRDAALLQRMRQITLDDPDLGVRGQAWMSWSVSDEIRPVRADLTDLWTARDEGVPPFYVGAAAGNLAMRTDGELRQEAIALMRAIALDARAKAGERRQVVDRLRRWLSAHEIQALEAAIAADDAKH